MNRNIKTEIAVGIILFIAILVGATFWIIGKKQTENPVLVKQNVATQTTQTLTNTRPAMMAQDPNEKIAETLSAKWSQSGLKQWQNKELLSSGIFGVFPADTAFFNLSQNGDQSLHSIELGKLIGKISAQHVEDNKLFGDCEISTGLIPDGATLELWINTTGVTMHQNYCKKYGAEDLRYPGNKTCVTKISIVKKIGDNIIEWNPEFIGSPDILSVLVGKTIVSFEMSQDISGGSVDFRTFLQDIASTLQVKQ